MAGDAAGLILDFQLQLAGMIGKPRDQKLHVHVTTEHPERYFELTAGPEGVTLAPADPDPAVGEATLRLPAEAFARLLSGRLDAEHPAQVEAYGVDLDDLRQVFPGF